jgi:hypothetical protein
VTEKLYQGLRAGSVPIYFGAPNIRDFLPHPDSVLLIEDFDNVEALIDYVRLACEDEQLYAKHMAWKSTEFHATFMNKVATKPMDSIFCETCDLIALKYGDGVGPSSGGNGDGLLLPWCIVRSLTANSDGLLRNWHHHNTLTQSEFILQIYVLSGKRASISQEFIRPKMASASYWAHLVTGYDENELDIDSIACWRPQSTLESRSQQDFIDLNVLSHSLKHVLALWDMWQHGYSSTLVINNDVTLSRSFNQDISIALQEVPPNWDIIFFDICSNNNVDNHVIEEVLRAKTHLIHLSTLSLIRCSNSYLWSYNGARKLFQSMPLRWDSLFAQIESASSNVAWELYGMEQDVFWNQTK